MWRSTYAYFRVYSCDWFMVAFALKVHFSIPCFKYLFQNIKHGSSNGIGVIRLGLPFTIEIVGWEEMLLKHSGL